MIDSNSPAPLTVDELRWRCDPEHLDFRSTEQVEPTVGIVGQDLAREALEFGLDCGAPGQNVFVRGERGTGRMRMVQDLLTQLRPICRNKQDRCFVRNFLQPDRPRLVSLPRGQGRRLRRRMRALADFVARELEEAMNSGPLQSSRTAMQEDIQRSIEAVTKPFEEALAGFGLALVQVKTARGTQPAIFPTWEGQAIAPEQLEALVRDGKITDETREQMLAERDRYARQLPEMTTNISRLHRKGAKRLEQFNDDNLRRLVAELVEPIRQDFNHEALSLYLDEVCDDVVEQTLHGAGQPFDPYARYGVNVLIEHIGDEAPIVIESNPTLTNLLGTIEPHWMPNGQPVSDYRGIGSGSLLAADGGYLVLDAVDVISEPGSWPILMRTLRTGKLEIVPTELQSPMAPIGLKPEPIPVRVRVILLGGSGLYYKLDASDADFRDLFKVLADFSGFLDRSDESIMHYAGVLSRIIRDEGLLHFTPDGVAALAEHGARIGGRANSLTARFGRVADIAREASWLASRAHAELVDGDHVRDAVRRTKRRASLPVSEFQARLKDRTVRIETSGSCVGQINGLAVVGAGPLTFGFPARITATIGAGRSGVIDIEGQARLSGSIHTKGFQILGGLLRHLLKTSHPLTYSASIAFEQSYGGIDGDSASGAEMLCMLSALTDLPLRQDLAITGAIDQHGALQAIGGVNEKIEGFFDICDHFGLTGTQGVVIPVANARDLMLRTDVVDACRDGRFAVYAVDRIEDALTLFTGRAAGDWDPEQEAYTTGSLLDLARTRAHEFWRETHSAPSGDATGE